MKKVLLIFFLALLTASGYAKKDKTPSPVQGTWKYSNGSSVNNFQQIAKMASNNSATTECFVFDANNEFRHNFVDKNGEIVKSLKGKWKIQDDKIKITYTDIDFQLIVNYFFLDKDLVLGQNFNHVIFSKDNVDESQMASK